MPRPPRQAWPPARTAASSPQSARLTSLWPAGQRRHHQRNGHLSASSSNMPIAGDPDRIMTTWSRLPFQWTSLQHPEGTPHFHHAPVKSAFTKSSKATIGRRTPVSWQDIGRAGDHRIRSEPPQSRHWSHSLPESFHVLTT